MLHQAADFVQASNQLTDGYKVPSQSPSRRLAKLLTVSDNVPSGYCTAVFINDSRDSLKHLPPAIRFQAKLYLDHKIDRKVVGCFDVLIDLCALNTYPQIVAGKHIIKPG